MPDDTQMSDGMDESYGGEPAVAPPEKPAEPKPASVDEENGSDSEILVAKKYLPEGVKVGDTFSVKLQKDYGDECSVTVVKGGGEDESEMESSESDNELEALNQESE